MFGVIVLITVFLGLFFVHRARYAQRLSSAGNVKKNPRKASDTDLQLEADGETMRDVKAVLHGGGETEGAKSPTSPAATADTAFSQDDAKSVQADVI